MSMKEIIDLVPTAAKRLGELMVTEALTVMDQIGTTLEEADAEVALDFRHSSGRTLRFRLSVGIPDDDDDGRDGA